MLRAARSPSSRLLYLGEVFALGGKGEGGPVMILPVEVIQKLFEYIVYVTVGFDQGVDVSDQ